MESQNDGIPGSEASRGYAFDVALSFSSLDGEIVDKLASKLKAMGIRVHYYKDAEKNVEYLKEWLGESILRSIERNYGGISSYAIIVYSENYLTSAYALRERDVLRLAELHHRQVLIAYYKVDETEFEDQVSKDALHIKHTGDESITLMAEAMRAKILAHDRISPKDIARRPFPLPFEPPYISKKWQEFSTESFPSAINDFSCAWALQLAGYPPDCKNLEIHFDPSSLYETLDFDRESKRVLKEHLRAWTSGDKSKDQRLRSEPYGWQVRLESVQYDHLKSRYKINLSQVKYWHYLATHASLWKSEEASSATPVCNRLRQRLFDKAITDIPEERRNILPSNFSLHMGIISADGHAILRKRRSRAELFPNVWEFGIGEFMHGPNTTDHRFYTFKNGQPDLYKFLIAAIREETYLERELDDAEIPANLFKIFGFAIEYVTLAPKLIVLHYSPRSKDEIIEGMFGATDRCEDVDAIPLRAESVVSAIRQNQESGWGPTSKLCLWLALRDQTDTLIGKKDVSRYLDECYRSNNS
jgi:hypothetical protein